MDNISNVIRMFPPDLQSVFASMGNRTLSLITEIRIRRNQPLIIYIMNTPFFINSSAKLLNHCTQDCLTVNDIGFDSIVDAVCSDSFHTKVHTMIKGYVTAVCGCRVGVASTAVYKDGKIFSVKDITSLNFRIAREILNCSRPVLNMLYVNQTPSVIIAGPPSSGKTTFLRDASRLLSSGFTEKYRKTVIIDERDEISSGFNVGVNTDVIRSFSKAEGIENAVRTLSPEIIICDEIGNENELESIKFGFSSGVSFIITVHAKNRDDLTNRSIIKKLISLGEFQYIVLLKDYTNDFEIYNITEDNLESGRKRNDNSVFTYGGNNDILT